LPSFTDSTQLSNATQSQLITTASPQLPSHTTQTDTTSAPTTNAIENALAYPLAERSLQVIVELFSRTDTSDVIRAAVYGDIAKVVGAAMMTKYSRYLCRCPSKKSLAPHLCFDLKATTPDYGK
jgi:hypothetical protein